MTRSIRDLGTKYSASSSRHMSLNILALSPGHSMAPSSDLLQHTTMLPSFAPPKGSATSSATSLSQPSPNSPAPSQPLTPNLPQTHLSSYHRRSPPTLSRPHPGILHRTHPDLIQGYKRVGLRRKIGDEVPATPVFPTTPRTAASRMPKTLSPRPPRPHPSVHPADAHSTLSHGPTPTFTPSQTTCVGSCPRSVRTRACTRSSCVHTLAPPHTGRVRNTSIRRGLHNPSRPPRCYCPFHPRRPRHAATTTTRVSFDPTKRLLQALKSAGRISTLRPGLNARGG